jgi:AraC family transcriptional regulator, activator of mtrCDE
MDWLSRLFEMMPVRGRLDLRCSYGAPWRIDQGPGEANVEARSTSWFTG